MENGKIPNTVKQIGKSISQKKTERKTRIA